MIALEYKGRYEPSFEATLDELFETVECYPMHNSQIPERRAGWLYLSTLGMKRPESWKESVHYYVKVTPTLAHMISARSIFETNDLNLPANHHLQLTERHDGSLVLGLEFQWISGYYTLTKLDLEQVVELLGKAREEM